MAGQSDFKGPARIVDRTATKRACLRWRSCPCGEPVGSGHHVLAKGSPYFGDDVLENIVPLCGDGTRGCHGLIENEDRAARRMLGRWLQHHRPDVIRYVLDKLGDDAGRDWMRRRLYLEVNNTW